MIQITIITKLHVPDFCLIFLSRMEEPASSTETRMPVFVQLVQRHRTVIDLQIHAHRIHVSMEAPALPDLEETSIVAALEDGPALYVKLKDHAVVVFCANRVES